MNIKIIALFMGSSFSAFAQSGELTIQQAIDLALKNNSTVKAATAEVSQQKELNHTSFDLPKTDVSLLYGQYNSYAKRDNNITISQTIPFTAFGSQGSLNRSVVRAVEMKKAVTENELVFQVKQTYYQLAYALAQNMLLEKQDSLYAGFQKAAALRYQTGETNLLEKTTAESQRNEAMNRLQRSETDIVILKTQLKTLLNTSAVPEIRKTTLMPIESGELPDTSASASNPTVAYMRQQVDVAHRYKKIEAAKFAPDLKVGFFTQTLIDVPDPENGRLATSGDRFTGFHVGLVLPIWFVPHQARVKAAVFNRQAAQHNYEYQSLVVKAQVQQAIAQLEKNKNSLNYYNASALPNADLILKQSQTSFRAGEISYAEYLLGLRQAISINEGYLQTLNDYNQSAIYLEFLSGNK